MDLVQRRGIHGEVVWPAIGLLQRNVVRQHGDVAGAIRLVAVEEIEVGGIHCRKARDVRRFAMARRHRCVVRSEWQQCRDGGRRQAGVLEFHVSPQMR